jgi:F-type H+-transporting ATPase subunit epsilon
VIQLSVVTPEKLFLEKMVESITLPGKMGEMQVLTGHIPSLVELKPGVVIFVDENNKTVRFMVGHGFAEIDAKAVNVLSEIARLPEEVNKDQERALLRDLEERIKKISPEEEEFRRISVELERSVASIKLVE